MAKYSQQSSGGSLVPQIHGYGHSDKTDKDWSGVRSAAADIAAAIEYITKLRGVSKVDLLGWSAGTQRAGLYAMQHPDRVAELILYAPRWKGDAGVLHASAEANREWRQTANSISDQHRGSRPQRFCRG